MRPVLFFCLALLPISLACGSAQEEVEANGTPAASTQETRTGENSTEAAPEPPPEGEAVELSESEWRDRLTAEQFHVLREEGTERAFTGQYHDHHGTGVYTCAGCGAELYSSETKFDSGTGWPSFYQPIADGQVRTDSDYSMVIPRTEIECARCGGHLGHVFDDGPAPTGKRHCVNSAALNFTSAD